MSNVQIYPLALFSCCSIQKISRSELFCKKGVLKNFAKSTGKYMCHIHREIQGLGPTTLLKKRLWHRWFPVNFTKFLRKPFFTEHLRWMLLSIVNNIFSLITFIHNPDSKLTVIYRNEKLGKKLLKLWNSKNPLLINTVKRLKLN